MTTVSLPSTLSLFRPAFDSLCNRILSQDQDAVFYALFVQLIQHLREHPLFKEVISQQENVLKDKRKELMRASLDAVEHHWKKLWQYHKRSYQHRKALVRIKRIVTAPCTIESSPLYPRMMFKMWEFRFSSPFFRSLEESSLVFRKIQSDMRFSRISAKSISPQHSSLIHKNISLNNRSRKNKKRQLYVKTFSPSTTKSPRRRTFRAEPISSLFSPLMQEMDQKFSLPGKNNHEKRLRIQMMAELHFSFCWERLHFLEKCCHMPISSLPLLRCLGKWEVIRKRAWKAAFERCERETLMQASMSLKQKMQSSTQMDAFLSVEHQIYRQDYEKLLGILKNHVHSHLLTFENTELEEAPVSTPDAAETALPGTYKEKVVIERAVKYWKIHPRANYHEVFTNYLSNCLPMLRLGRSRWEQVVRKCKLDPRPKNQKTRGPGKKTRKK